MNEEKLIKEKLVLESKLEELMDSKIKKIIQQKIPLDIYMKIPIKEIRNWHNTLQSILGDNYIVITSPFDLECIDGDEKIIKIEAKEYSYNDLMEVIEKAEMYEGLCK